MARRVKKPSSVIDKRRWPIEQRRLRLGEEIRHHLSVVLQHGEFRDPRLADRNITVTEVSVSDDLGHAKVYIMPLGGQEITETVEILRHASTHLRGILARSMQLRYAPRLRFVADDTFQYAERIEQLLRNHT